jgi:hypothetical protein
MTLALSFDFVIHDYVFLPCPFEKLVHGFGQLILSKVRCFAEHVDVPHTACLATEASLNP